jgi:S-DNA-T family DNA segregation ATPase FtsK/SpoIIIE
MLSAYRERKKVEYEYLPEEEPAPPRKLPDKAAPAEDRRRAAIDIPVGDEEEEIQDRPRQGFFNRTPRVKTPDQLLIEPPQNEETESNEPKIIFESSQYYDEEKSEAEVSPQSGIDAALEGETEPVTQLIIDPPSEPAPKKRLKPEEVAEISRDIEKEIEKSPDTGEYRFPPLSLLHSSHSPDVDAGDELKANRDRIEAVLESFGVSAAIVGVIRGPTVTRYDLELSTGVKLNKLTGLADDLALSLGVSAVRVAPIPNKVSTVGIEVPNYKVSTVYLRDIVDTPEFSNAKSKLSFAIGKDISGNVIVGDITKLPHLLIAGTTGSGKSVCVNSMILSILYKSSPEEVRFILIDPKMVEFVVYNESPHLYIPVVTDPKKAAGALQWAVVEMMKRYRLFSEMGVRDLAGYNKLCQEKGQETIPNVVIVIDELADLMIAAAKEVEESICRVAQMGRASGMHLVIATQRPSADVITGLMKANIPSRIALFVRSAMDSRIILDTQGADKLVGNGDMLFLPVGAGKPLRVQGAWVSDEERESVVEFVKSTGEADYSEEIINEIERTTEDKSGKQDGGEFSSDYDELLPDAVEVIFETKQASVSMLQRRLKLGYARAARIVDQMEELGVVGSSEGSKPRQILITIDQWRDMQLVQGNGPIKPPEQASLFDEDEDDGDYDEYEYDNEYGDDMDDDDMPPFDIDE